jgi:hypothetical protein
MVLGRPFLNLQMVQKNCTSKMTKSLTNLTHADNMISAKENWQIDWGIRQSSLKR